MNAYELRAKDFLDDTQIRIVEWISHIFGLSSIPALRAAERGRRMLEEATELAQAVGVTSAEAAAIQEHVFSRPVGEVGQELGGASLTLLATAEALGFSVFDELMKELRRGESKPKSHWTARLAEKERLGLSQAP